MSVMGWIATFTIAVLADAMLATFKYYGLLHSWGWLFVGPVIIAIIWASSIFEQINYTDIG